MTTIFLIHGSFGNPNENWFPWLKTELEALGHELIVPKFPTPIDQSLESWRKIFSKHKAKIDQNTIFIGHSLGPAFILDILQQSNKKISVCFFVSGFLGLLGNPEFDQINQTFTDRKFNFNKIRSSCQKIIMFHSNNDPYVPIEKANELQQKLDADLKIIDNGGHFNKESGFLQFPQLLKEIKKNLVIL
ncbi:serine hydrolase family protein [archaeon]|jgi:uncharacterized protein|nr:serine hydrolase family protein [archaeon]MBT6762226.1 serine hydrolase family protein [archaeon]